MEMTTESSQNYTGQRFEYNDCGIVKTAGRTYHFILVDTKAEEDDGIGSLGDWNERIYKCVEEDWEVSVGKFDADREWMGFSDNHECKRESSNPLVCAVRMFLLEY